MSLNNIIDMEIFDGWGFDFTGPLPFSRENKYIFVVVDYVFKLVEVVACPTNDARSATKFVNRVMFPRFRVTTVLISDVEPTS